MADEAWVRRLAVRCVELDHERSRLERERDTLQTRIDKLTWENNG